ncbi:MAG TPA: zinc ABC transporter substrate-binding protein [Enteractinococcus sp.]
MNSTWKVAIVAASTLTLAGCSEGNDSPEAADSGTVQAVSTFSILTDIVEEIGGEHVEVYNLVPVGQDPHEYESTPSDTKALSDADIFFINGLNLEGGDQGWAARMASSVGMADDRLVETTQGVEPLYLTEGVEDSVNPHAFLDPNVGVIMAENIAETLAEVDPEHAETYQGNAEAYIEELTALDAQYQQEIGDLEEERRVLVTSERAFQYVAHRYDLLEGYIWSVDTDDIGTPDQIISAIDFVKEHQPPALFLESNVASTPMETVAADTGVEIYATVFSDELAADGEPGDSYLGLLQENLTRISEGLQQ